MDKLKKLMGYSLAWLSVQVVMATFLGWNFWASHLASATGVKVSPWFTGGEELRTIDHGSYKTVLHRPVFDGLLWDKQEGFIQVNFRSANPLPSTINEDIDIDGDGQKDFSVQLDVSKLQGSITPHAPTVLGLEGVYKVKDGVAVRVNLKK